MQFCPVLIDRKGGGGGGRVRGRGEESAVFSLFPVRLGFVFDAQIQGKLQIGGTM